MHARAPSLDLRLYVSRQLMLAVAVLHMLAIAILLAGPLPWLSLFASLNAVLMMNRHGIWLYCHQVRFRLAPSGNALSIDGSSIKFHVLASSVIWYRVIVLKLLLEGSHWPRCLILLPDSAPSADLRRLRVMARLGAIGLRPDRGWCRGRDPAALDSQG